MGAHAIDLKTVTKCSSHDQLTRFISSYPLMRDERLLDER